MQQATVGADVLHEELGMEYGIAPSTTFAGVKGKVVLSAIWMNSVLNNGWLLMDVHVT